MWKKIKKTFNFVYRISLAVILIGFMFFTFFTLIIEDLRMDTNTMSIISLVVVLLSLPGIVDTIANEVNPKKKNFKLSCRCPRCKNLIEMDMKEE